MTDGLATDAGRKGYPVVDIEGRARMKWMDLLRGAAILAVLYYHAILMSSSAVHIPSALKAANDYLTPIRMPLMMLLSGLLVAPSMAKGSARYFAGKLRRIGWPYLVWTFFMIAISILRSPEKQNVAAAANRIVELPLYAVDHLWFLYYLMIFYTAEWLLRRITWWVGPSVFVLLAWAAQIDGHDTAQKFAYLLRGLLPSRRGCLQQTGNLGGVASPVR